MSKRSIARLLFFLIFLACAAYIVYYMYDAKHNSDKAGARADTASRINTNTGEVKAVTTVDESTGEERRLIVLSQYEKLYEQNKNLIGWIKIDDTNIDYPVMKSLNGNGEFYLDHDYNGNEDRNGTIFMDDACDVIKPTENYIIYGHNMKSGQMFGDLKKYKSESFFNDHQIVKFDSIYEPGIYQVMFAFQSHVYEENVIAFKYYQFIEPASEKEFNSGIEEMRAQALYDSGISAQYGDRLLLLSTCDYDEANGRFVVVCKKIDK